MNEEKLMEFIGKMLGDLGAAASGPLIILGDRLGLFRAVAAQEGQTSAEIAQSAGGLDERYVREWLSCMAASGYMNYDAEKDAFSMSDEQKAVFADPNSPVALTGGYYAISSMYSDEPRLTEAFQSGEGVSWGDHHDCLFCGAAKFFRPGYAAHLVQEWLPALHGISDKLKKGAKVADVGCGHGCSTTIMAAAFPESEFIGFDNHPASIEKANQRASEEGLSNVRFEIGAAKDYPGSDYDLVAFFDCLHDMGDPSGAADHVKQSLSTDGSWMIVEPMAGNSLAENLNPVGRLYYAFSTMICTPASRSQEVGLALGAQAGEKRLRDVIVDGGFKSCERVAETPFNMILEARVA